MTDFTGFPVAALDFYDDLEVDNTKSLLGEAQARLRRSRCKAPMMALCAALGRSSATAKVFRPYRDVRFAKDKTPYKTHQGAFVARRRRRPAGTSRSRRAASASAPASTTPRRPAAGRDPRRRSADDTTGAELERILAALRAERLRRSAATGSRPRPRGYDADHPRIELLRHKSLIAGRAYGFEPVIHTPKLLDLVRKDWRACRPLVEWVATHAADRAPT